MILNKKKIAKKYKLLLLKELEQHDPALEERYKIELDSKNKMKNSIRGFLKMKPCVDASDTISQESLARRLSLPAAEVALSSGLLKEASLSLMERVFQSDCLQDRVSMVDALKNLSVSHDLLREFSVSSQEAFVLYCGMSALSTLATPECIEDEQKAWQALLASSGDQPQSSWYREAKDHIETHLDGLQTIINKAVKEETDAFKKQLQSEVKSDWRRDMAQCRQELKKRYSTIPNFTREIDRLVPLEPTHQQMHAIWSAVHNSQLKQVLYESALSDINEKRWRRRLEVYAFEMQSDLLDEQSSQSSEATVSQNIEKINTHIQSKIQPNVEKTKRRIGREAQKRIQEQTKKEFQKKAKERARKDTDKKMKAQAREEALKHAKEVAHQESKKRSESLARQESKQFTMAVKRSATVKQSAAVKRGAESGSRTGRHVIRNPSSVRGTVFNYRSHSGDEYNRLGPAINEMSSCIMSGR